MRRVLIRAACVFTLLWAACPPARATWSIVLADSETGEVAVGTVTCLTSFDLLAIVPVVVVGKGGAAVQAAGDFQGIRRPIIFKQLGLGTDPADILILLQGIAGHQRRQYGIVDTQGRKITFTGTQTIQWAGGVIGQQGSMHYAIQANIMVGACVVESIEQAVLGTPGDFPDKLMAGMQAAREQGGDGRCSCPGDPMSCGCPVMEFDKSGHIGGVIVARIGDIDDTVCNAGGCADGDYLMRLNVPFQSPGDPDPVDQLQVLFAKWRGEHVGRPDAVHSTVAFDPPMIPANGVATTTMTVTLLDWQDEPIDVPLVSIDVQHAPDSAGRSTIGAVNDNGDGTIDVELTAGTAGGLDRFRVVVDDGIRPVTIMPDPSFEYFTPGDIDGNGSVEFADLLVLLSEWGPCPGPPDPCRSDLDGDGSVTFADLLLLLSNWS